jgi:predicted transcriptional regulator
MFRGLWAHRWRRAQRDPLGAALGALEREVMDVLWSDGRFNVRDVQARLPRQVAYTTVMTTLDRLFKKGLAARTRAGRAFVYSTALTRAEFEAAVAGGVVSGLLSNAAGGATPILSNLVDAVGSEDPRLLETLEQLVREKRRALRQERE